MVAHMSPRDLKAGQWVDGFRIIRRIGQGYHAPEFERNALDRLRGRTAPAAAIR